MTDPELVCVFEGVPDPDPDCVVVTDGVIVRDAVCEGVFDALAVILGLTVDDWVDVSVLEDVPVREGVPVCVAVTDDDPEEVCEIVPDFVGERDAVPVVVPLPVIVWEGVDVLDGVLEFVCVGVPVVVAEADCVTEPVPV